MFRIPLNNIVENEIRTHSLSADLVLDGVVRAV